MNYSGDLIIGLENWFVVINSYINIGHELKSRLNVLIFRFDVFLTKIIDLRKKVVFLDTGVLAFDIHSQFASTYTPVNKVIQKFAERDRCNSSIIAYGILEPTSSNLV